MDGTCIKFKKTLSGSNFYQKIIKKYHTDKRSSFRFTSMIFRKSRGYIFPKKIKMDFLLQFHFDNQKIVSSVIINNFNTVKVMLSCLKTEKIILQLIGKQKNIQTANEFSVISYLKPVFFRIENVATKSNKILKPLFSALNAAFDLQTTDKISFNNATVDSQFSNYVNIMQILNSQIPSVKINHYFFKVAGQSATIDKENTRMYQSAFEHIYPWKRQNTEFVNRIPVVSYLKSVFFRVENIVTEPNRIQIPLFLAINADFYRRVIQKISLNSEAMNPRFLNYSSNMQILNYQMPTVGIINKFLNTVKLSTSTDIKKEHKYQSAFDNLSSLDNLSIKSTLPNINRVIFKNLSRATVNKPLISDQHYSFDWNAVSPVQRTYAYKTGSESLRFYDQKTIEQEIEQIKKMVTETRESVLEKSTHAFGEADIKKHLDINRISDQVYQNIERTIRKERERRGM